VARLCPDPLGELIALCAPQTSSWIKGRVGLRNWSGREGKGKREGKQEMEGPPNV